MLGKYCGTAAPAELFSSHNSLYFWFRSDSSRNAGGFTVSWESRAPGRGTIVFCNFWCDAMLFFFLFFKASLITEVFCFLSVFLRVWWGSDRHLRRHQLTWLPWQLPTQQRLLLDCECEPRAFNHFCLWDAQSGAAPWLRFWLLRGESLPTHCSKISLCWDCVHDANVWMPHPGGLGEIIVIDYRTTRQNSPYTFWPSQVMHSFCNIAVSH